MPIIKKCWCQNFCHNCSFLTPAIWNTDIINMKSHQYRITSLFTAPLQQRWPLPNKNRAADWRLCILCRRTSCIESLTDRTETRAVVDSNIQAPSEVFFSFSHGILTTQCTLRLTVGGALQILMLLLLYFKLLVSTRLILLYTDTNKLYMNISSYQYCYGR